MVELKFPDIMLADLVIYRQKKSDKRTDLATVVLNCRADGSYLIDSAYSLNKKMVSDKNIELLPTGVAFVSRKSLDALIKIWCSYINIRGQIYTEFVGN